MNAGGAKSAQPAENIFWKINPPNGQYNVYVNHYAIHDTVNASNFQVVISIGEKTVWTNGGIVSHGQKQMVKTFNYPWT